MTAMKHPREVVLVTGGARRLGAALCREYARRGRVVVCHYLHAERDGAALVDELCAAGAEAYGIQGDLRTLDGVEQVFAQACERAGAIDVLVNNAAAFEFDSGLEPSVELWDLHLALNLRAPLWLASRAARHCAQRGVRGVAIHVLDQKVHALNPDYFSYTVSKLALAGSVKLQAQALAPHLRVIGIVPGLLGLSGPQSAENFDWAARQNLLREPVAMRDVATACADASGNPSISGALIDVDCGQHLLPQPRDVMFLGPGHDGPR
jgi:NAD(P)-dependent dehydrogenase (short-subunit alcohol dehydrogenase family)